MDIFKNFKQVVKIKEVSVDNKVFQLHYQVTSLLLLGSAALVASKQHFGDPIDCIMRDDVPSKVMDTYCWIHSTFTMESACNKTVGVEIAHPCVDKFMSNDEERTYHKYYQWVYFVLAFQAGCFYAPHIIWKACESRLLYKLTEKLRNPIFKEKEVQSEIELIVKYFTSDVRFRHRMYFHYFIICEAMNFVNVIAQIYLVDMFLGGTFTTYGIDVIKYVQMDQDDRVDPMIRVFPRMTKCTFNRFGPSGDVTKHDSLCILPLNIINEKIYIFMWFWFVFLAVITGLWMVFRLFTFSKSTIRCQVLSRRASLCSKEKIECVLKNLNKGDWFLLLMICRNTDSQLFRLLLNDIFSALKSNNQTGEKYSPSKNSKRDKSADIESGLSVSFNEEPNLANKGFSSMA